VLLGLPVVFRVPEALATYPHELQALLHGGNLTADARLISRIVVPTSFPHFDPLITSATGGDQRLGPAMHMEMSCLAHPKSVTGV
jgi:hypothetical protein